MNGDSVNGDPVNGDSVKMTSDSYNFASKLAIETYLGNPDAYTILNTSQAH